MIDSALIIKKEWLDLILTGSKTWELRSVATKKRGLIGLIESGSGLIVGTANLVDVMPKIETESVLNETWINHRFDLGDDSFECFKWRFPWVFSEAERLLLPVPYSHPMGAVTWVNLESGALS